MTSFPSRAGFERNTGCILRSNVPLRVWSGLPWTRRPQLTQSRGRPIGCWLHCLPVSRLEISIMATTVKRLHDWGQSGWWGPAIGVLALVGMELLSLLYNQALLEWGNWGGGAGFAAFIFWLIGSVRGTIGNNRFGPDPVPPPPGVTQGAPVTHIMSGDTDARSPGRGPIGTDSRWGHRICKQRAVSFVMTRAGCREWFFRLSLRWPVPTLLRVHARGMRADVDGNQAGVR